MTPETLVLADESAQPKLPERIRRELRTGETIYHSMAACYRSSKFPDGKWVGQVRRTERGRLVKYPVKAFGNPQLALAYVKSLRADAQGRVASSAQGEATVTDLYEFVRKHNWKKLGAKRVELKESRWRLHIEPFWGLWQLSQVTKRAAQEWVTEVETLIKNGQAGLLGLPQFCECRMDLHGLFDAIGSFDDRFEDRKNPFKGLAFETPPQRSRVCIESQYFAAIQLASDRLVAERLCTDWVAAMFMTSLLSGLRLGEVIAICRDQIDFANGSIWVDRAMREKSRELDPRSMKPVGEIQRVSVNLPKGDKVRAVPMSGQLEAVLRPFFDRGRYQGAKWDFVFASGNGNLKEQTLIAKAFRTYCKRMNELAGHESRCGRGWPRNPLIAEFRKIQLPDIWGEITFRDTRNSFASYAEEVGIPQATREAILGHGAKGVTNRHYTDITTRGFQEARRRLTLGWKALRT